MFTNYPRIKCRTHPLNENRTCILTEKTKYPIYNTTSCITPKPKPTLLNLHVYKLPANQMQSTATQWKQNIYTRRKNQIPNLQHHVLHNAQIKTHITKSTYLKTTREAHPEHSHSMQTEHVYSKKTLPNLQHHVLHILPNTTAHS